MQADVVFMTVGNDHAFNLVAISRRYVMSELYSPRACSVGKANPASKMTISSVLENAGIFTNFMQTAQGNNFDGGVGFVFAHCVLRLFLFVKI